MKTLVVKYLPSGAESNTQELLDMGYSMGGFQTLFMAAQSATNDGPLLKFERYVAIDAPVRLRCAVRTGGNQATHFRPLL